MVDGQRERRTSPGLCFPDCVATELALSAYRPFPGKAYELQAFFAVELATLRRRGHVTERRAPVVRTVSELAE